MKYFDEEKNIIKAQAGTSTYYFIRQPEPVVDNMGGLGSAVYHNQSVQRQQEVNREQAAMEAQRQREEAARRQPQLRQGRSESELQRSRQQQRQAELNQRRNEQRSTMVNFDPTGTAHTQAAVQAMPYVTEATRNYFNRPIGDIIGGEVENGANLIMAPWTGMGRHLQQMGIAGQDRRYFDAAGHALGATANGALIFAGTRAPVGEVPAVQTTSRAINTTARRVKNAVSNSANKVRQTAQTAGEQVGEGLRNFGNQVQEGFNYTFGQSPILQPAYVGGVPGTMRTPWTLYEPVTTAPRTQNFLGLEIRDGGLHRKEGWWGKHAESAPAAEATPRSSFNGYYDESGNPVTLYERTDPKATYYRRDESYGTAYEKVPQTQEIYDEALNPVDINATVPGTKYVYSDNTPATIFREVQTPIPMQEYYRAGESIPSRGFFDTYEPSPNTEGLVTAKGTPATNIYKEVNPQTANRYKSYEGSDGEMYGYGQGAFNLYDSPLKSNRREITPTNEELVPNGKPNLYQAYRAAKNPSNAGNRKILHQRAGNKNDGTVVSDPIDPSFLKDVRSKGAWLPGHWKFNTTLAGILKFTGPGKWVTKKAWNLIQLDPSKKEENPQQTNDTTPENTPTNTSQTPDTTGRAARMAQRRKELGIE